MRERIPVLIDCDPGVDDAHALLMALASPCLDVRAITTVAGNMPVETTFSNARKVVALSGHAVPVYRGCPLPLLREPVPPSHLFHGENGLGGAVLPAPEAPPEMLHAVEAMRQAVVEAKGRLHIIALGPLTNLALLFRMYPGLIPEIAQLTIMGGAREGGNISPHAEFNFFCDAEAASIVLCCGRPITLVDLTGCDSAGLTEEDTADITGIASAVSPFVAQLWAFNLALAKSFGGSHFVLHDSIAVASVLEPPVLELDAYIARLDCTDSDTYGKSLLKKSPAGNVMLTTGVDREKFLRLCKETMRQYPV